MASLIQLTKQANEILSEVMENDGELDEVLDQKLIVSEVEIKDKVDKYASLLDRADVEIEYFKQKKKELNDIQKRIEKMKDRLKDILKYASKELDRKELHGNSWKFQFKNVKPSLVIKDESKIPMTYFREKVEAVLMKDQLRADLLKGIEVPGVDLEYNKSLIRAHKPEQLDV